MLWLVAAASLGATGCNTKEASRGSETSTQEEAKPADSPVATTTTEAPVELAKLEAEPLADRKSATKIAGKKADRSRMPRRPVAVSQPLMGPGFAAAGGDSTAMSAGNTEDYTDYGVNPMTDTAEDHLSTFAVDVDTASYAIARKKILAGQLPPTSAVRVEEFVNYFTYEYASPTDGSPFAVHMDAAPSPFSKSQYILRVGVQAKKLSLRERKAANLVFLVDVSGSMSAPDKLELAKRALRILVDNLKDGDTVALVTYAGNTRVVLEPTGLEKKADIVSAIEDLSSGGSTAMASGLELAYGLAAKNLAPDTISRVIVLSDGDANVGNTSHQAILKAISKHVKEGVTMSTVGFGMGNYKDTMMEQLANKGNGNYSYIDGLSQAKRVFQQQLGGTLEVVAKDVKIQVDFNDKAVKKYRLIGYENRDIADNDFRNDKVDAGEIGAGHTVTALYEVELTQSDEPLATVRIRAKKPRGTKATETAYPFDRDQLYASFDAASSDFRFATAVMATAEILRGSKHAQNWDMGRIMQIARAAAGDENPERQEFLALQERINTLRGKIAAR